MAGRILRYHPIRITLPALAVTLLAALVWAAPAAHAAATLSLSQSEGLTDGQTITAKGSGFNANINLFVAECDSSVPSGGACDMTGFKQATTDASGSFSVELRVSKVFGAGVDCAVKPCGIQTSWVQDPKDKSQEQTVRISFAGSPPAKASSAAPVTTPASTPAASPIPTGPVTDASTSSAGSSASSTGGTAGTGQAADAGASTSDSEGSALPWILIGIAVVLVAGGGGFWFLRKRHA